MADPFGPLGQHERAALTDEDAPSLAPPLLAVLVHEAFSSPDWVFERKLDGERCVAMRDGDEVHPWSRSRESLDATYPEPVEALAAQGRERFVVDGEVVAFDGSITSFERLRARLGIEDPDEARATGGARGPPLPRRHAQRLRPDGGGRRTPCAGMGRRAVRVATLRGALHASG